MPRTAQTSGRAGRSTNGSASVSRIEREIREHYATGYERDRLTTPAPRLELLRTQELLERFLPSQPADVLDVGGGAGVYASWLSRLGHRVHLVDALELHVEQALEAGGFEASLGDARSLAQSDASQDVVLLLGPLYHLTEEEDRLLALGEALRVLRPGGLLAAAAICRFASVFDGLRHRFLADPAFEGVVERDLLEGQHRNPKDEEGWFTTAYFHHPEGLADEVSRGGFEVERVFGVEGPGWLFESQWPDDPELLVRVARLVEDEPLLVGTSAHLLAIARKGA